MVLPPGGRRALHGYPVTVKAHTPVRSEIWTPHDPKLIFDSLSGVSFSYRRVRSATSTSLFDTLGLVGLTLADDVPYMDIS